MISCHPEPAAHGPSRRRRPARDYGPLLALLLVSTTSAAATGHCRFDDRFATPDVDGPVFALTVHADPTGDWIYAGGNFSTAGGRVARGVARFDGHRFAPVPGIRGGVGTLALLEVGGEALTLYAGGVLEGVVGSDSPGAGVARLRGGRFELLGTGSYGSVYALASFDRGAGAELYAAGDLVDPTSFLHRGVLRYDGTNWHDVGGLYVATALATFDDGSGARLYAAGALAGAPESIVGRYDGTTWSAVGELAGEVSTFVIFDDGGGPRLWAGGSFLVPGRDEASGVVFWDGRSWRVPGDGLAGHASTLAVVDRGAGPELLAGGAFAVDGGASFASVMRLAAGRFVPLADPPTGTVVALAAFGVGADRAVYAGGYLAFGHDGAAYHLARLGPDGWQSPIVPGGEGLLLRGAALTTWPGVGGPQPVIGGDLLAAGADTVSGVTRWDGTSWKPLGDGLGGRVEAFATVDLGDGPRLYAGGLIAGGVAAFDGDQWTPPGGGVNGVVSALAAWDDGGTPALVAGGIFEQAGDTPALAVARFDGTSWQAMGNEAQYITSLAVLEVGVGPTLYAGGSFAFTPGEQPLGRVARWDGSHWRQVGSGLIGVVNSFALFDDGTGPALYAGGFLFVNHVQTALARLDDGVWTAPAGAMIGGIGALEIHDDGTGPALYLGGSFEEIGGVRAPGLARFDGERFAPVGNGTDHNVFDLLSLAGPDGPELWLAGDFAVVGGLPSSRVGRYVCDPAAACRGTDTLCLLDGRFEASLRWWTPNDKGIGQSHALTDRAGFFAFRNPENLEVVVKLVDACATPSPAVWAFAAGLTNQDTELTLRDTRTAERLVLDNPLGSPFGPQQVTNAFRASCAP